MSGSNRLGIKGAIASLIAAGTLCTGSFAQFENCPNPKGGNCFEATPGIPGCQDEECCNLVCAVNPLCCLDGFEWDEECVSTAIRECLGDCDTCGSLACHDCFDNPQGTDNPFCNDECDTIQCPGCCETVCAADSYCCDTDWDGICVGEAMLLCPCVPEDAPANDDCANAIDIAEGVFEYTTLCGTQDGPSLPGTPCNAKAGGVDGVGIDVWFDYTATNDGPVRVHTCDVSDYETQVAVYEGCACPADAATLIDCNEDGAGCGAGSEVIFEAVAGACYKISVGGTYANTGSGTLIIEPLSAPANDDCASALPINLDQNIQFNNFKATVDGNPSPVCDFGGNNDIERDVWFSFMSPVSATVQVSLCASSFDTKAAVYEGGECPPIADPIVCDDDGCGLQSVVEFEAVKGETYLFRVGSRPGTGGGVGQIRVRLPPPPPDFCPDPFNTEITQNTDNSLIDTGGVSCQAGGVTVENAWARAYDLSVELPGQVFSINCVEFAMNNSDSDFLVGTVTIYEDIDGGEPGSPGTDLVVLGSKDFGLPAGTSLELFQASFDPPVVAPADSTIVVAIDLPPALDGVGVYAGNSAGQSRCTYLLSEPCDILTFTCTDDVPPGFPDLHMLQTIRGNVGAPCPWDLDGNLDVGVNDLLILLAAWGPNPGHPADFDGNNDVGVNDLLILLANWGPCPP